MIYFDPLRTRRLSVDLQELSIDDAETLCMMPEHLEQASITALLQRAVKPNDREMPGQVGDPRMWTVQERMMVMAHYMAHTTDDGERNFSLGDGRLSDYLLNGTDYVESISLGVIDGDEILMRPLLGFQAEAIERLVLGGRFRANRLSWWACAMACQMTKAGEEPKPYQGDAEYLEWVYSMASAIRQLPESDFLQLLYAFLDGTKQLDHFFKLTYTDLIIATKPTQEDSSLPSARFPLHAAFSTGTLQVLGITRSDESGSGAVLQPAA